MKRLPYIIAYALAFLWLLASLPFFVMLWALGAERPFDHFSNAVGKILKPRP